MKERDLTRRQFIAVASASSLLFVWLLAEQGTRVQPTLLPGLMLASAAACLLMGTAGESGRARTVQAAKQCDGDGHPKFFTLSLGADTVTLDPGKSWIKVDAYKWVTRGLIESPQSFHVLPNGTVEINGEKISLADTEGTLKLEREINKSHAAPIAGPAKVAASLAHKPATPQTSPGSGKVHFKVELDHLGHLMIKSARGAEKLETGLRGLQLLVTNGLMLPPNAIHVDPLQRAVEIDGVRFECSDSGARQLEAVLNEKYAAPTQVEGEGVISIKDSPASPTGFDISFVTYYLSGTRVEIKGHLSQDKLDILQDPARCRLLQSDVEFRLTPPDLLIRRKRPDGGEEHIPELPDLQYRRTTAAELQRIFNHPLVRSTKSESGQEAPTPARKTASIAIEEIRVVRNPVTRALLWLEFRASQTGEIAGKAMTHHNIADLQHHGVFMPHLDVALSLDNQRLSILNKETKQEEAIDLGLNSPEEDLLKAGKMLTAALKVAAPD
jgi:hypothetical protein